MFKFPVKCPVCRREQIIELPKLRIVAALVGFQPIQLHTTCHDQFWNANAAEMEQLREFVATEFPQWFPTTGP
jgi:hypothetical protein